MVHPRFTAFRYRLLAGLAVAVLLCLPASVSAAQRTGRLLVLVDNHAERRATTNTLERLGARKAGDQVPEVGLVTVRPVAGRSLAATAAALRTLPWVSSVTPERRASLRFKPNDPALSESQPGAPEGTLRQWWAQRENLLSAWDVTRGTEGKVAIIDSGIDGAHPEFAGKIALTRDNDNQPGAGPATVDERGHGTHVASLACARSDNAVGIAGAGMNCNLIVVKSDLTDSSVAKSIVEATDLGADSINMSFGFEDGDPPQSLVEAIDYAVDHDVVLVAAAANDPIQDQGDPASILQPTGTGADITFNKGLTVTSASFDNVRSSFAGRGSQISLAAYGNYSSFSGPRGILGALPAGRAGIDDDCSACRTTLGGDRRYGYLSGTSMAAPQVSGIAALVATVNPDLRASTIVRLLKETATRAHSGWEPELGWGIVNAGAAVERARGIDRRPPRSKARGPKRLRSRTTFTLTWTGKDLAPPGIVVAGIRRYHVYRAKNGGTYRKIATTTKKRRTIKTQRGARYRYYTVAVDKRGNREKKPSRADVSLRVSRSR